MSEQLIVDALNKAEVISPPYQPIEYTDFIAREFLPREMLLSPIIPQAGLVMLFAPRGIGKTYVALTIAHAVACGGQCLGWRAEKPRKVIYIDGEMPGIAIQQRLAKISGGVTPAPGHFGLLVADLMPSGMPDLSVPENWDKLWPFIAGADLLVLDNISTLCRQGRENEAESWGPIQEMLLKLRRAGIAVLMVHHAGKTGQQRGTSKREDVLDTVISLRRPGDYQPSDGARFEVHFDKTRGFYGDEAAAFEAQLQEGETGLQWVKTPVVNGKLAQAGSLFEQGVTVRQAAATLGISTSQAGRLRQQWQEGQAK